MPFTSETAAQAGKKSSRKGKGNETTAKIREHYSTLIENNLEKLQEDLDSLEPRERIDAIVKLSKFAIPTLRSVELTDDERGVKIKPIVISFKDHDTD